jgi:hypothetical protein
MDAVEGWWRRGHGVGRGDDVVAGLDLDGAVTASLLAIRKDFSRSKPDCIRR